jgi:colanic acid/amylovoran biosynthesis glycosyltransferase
MRVAILAGTFPLPSETFVLNQVVGLLNRGVEIDVYAGRPPNEKWVRQVHPGHDFRNHVTYWPTRLSDFPRATAGLIKIVLSRQGRNFFEQAILGNIGNAPISRVERLIMGSLCHSRREYDAILAHFGPVGMIAQALRQMGALRGPLVTVFHGFDLSGVLYEKGWDYYEQFLSQLDLALPVSDFWRQRLLALGADEKRVVVHHMGIDCERFVFRPRRPAKDGSVMMIAVARLVEKKGIEYAIRAFAQIADKHALVTFGIVGDGPLRARLEAVAADLGIAGRVNFLGWRTPEEVRELLANAHILIAPSVTSADGDMEGIPVSIMEAMAQGMPVITTRHSGIPELVETGKSGLVVSERNTDELAQAVDHMISSPHKWEAMGSSGRKCVEGHFNQSALNDQLVETLRSFSQ